jgi:hypothetical protein
MLTTTLLILGHHNRAVDSVLIVYERVEILLDSWLAM